MGCDEYNICHSRGFGGLVSLTIVSFLFFLLPQSANAKINDDLIPSFLIQAQMGETELLREQFNSLEKVIDLSADPVRIARKFLYSFIEAINARFNTDVTLLEVRRAVQEEQFLLQLPEEIRSDFILAIKLITTEDHFSMNEIKFNCAKEIGSSAKKKQFGRMRTKTKKTGDLPGQLQPGTIIGGLEILAGAAVGLVFGSTLVGGVVAGGLIADGIHLSLIHI